MASFTVAFTLASIAIQQAISTRTGHNTHVWTRLTMHFAMSLCAGLLTLLCLASHVVAVFFTDLAAVTLVSSALEIGAIASQAFTFAFFRCALDIAGSLRAGLLTRFGVAVHALQVAAASYAITFTLWSFALNFARPFATLCTVLGTYKRS